MNSIDSLLDKIDLFFKKYLGNKFTITNDYNFLFIGLSDDDIINFIFDNFTLKILSLKIIWLFFTKFVTYR